MSIKSIGKIARNSYVQDLIRAVEKELKITYDDALKVQDSLMIVAGEQEIELWEKWFRLTTEPTWTLEDRRNRLIYTFNSRGFFTEKWLKNLALTFTNGEISVTQEYEEYHFIVQFTSIIGQPPNIDNFKQMVELNKPAHLTWELRYRFRTHGELKQYPHLMLKNFTHEQLRSLAKIN